MSASSRRDLDLPWLLGVGLLALVLRVVHVLLLRESPGFEAPIMDALYHLDWARSFAAGETFQEGPFFRAPLYPWFLGLLLKVSGGSLLACRLVQALLGSLSVVLVQLIAGRAFDRPTSRLAGVSAATYWVLVYFDGELLIPTLLVPLLLLGLYLILGVEREEGTRSKTALAPGLAFGLAAIARPNVLLLMPVLALWLWRGKGAGLSRALMLTLGVLIPILPITLYNGLVGGDWSLVSTQGGVNFWIGNNPQSDGSTAIVPGTRGGWWEGYHDSIAQAEAAEGRELQPSEVSRHYAGRAMAWIQSDPAGAASHLLWKLRLFWTDWELGNNSEVRFFAMRFDPLLRWLPLGFAGLAGAGLVGLVLVLTDPRRRAALLPLWAFLLVYMASVVLFFVCSRFRVPVLPVLAILGSHAVIEALRSLRAGGRGRAGALLLAMALAGTLTRIRPASLETSEANGYLQLGVHAMGEGELLEAQGHLTYASQLDADNVFARTALAWVLLRRGELEAAEQEVETLFGIDALRADTWEVWLELKLVQGQPDQLLAECERARTSVAELALLDYYAGQALIGLQRYQDAQAALRAAVRRDPGHFGATYALGVLLMETGGAAGSGEARTMLEAARQLGASSEPRAMEDIERRLAELP